MQLRVLDLFAGCGGISAGLHNTGLFRTVGAVEMDRDAADTYEANFDIEVLCDRIERIPDFPAADVLVGGPPCQGFSPLNRNGVGFERRALWREYLRALDAVEPAVFLMENVPELLRSAEFAMFDQAAARRGYAIEARVLNMANYGVPQRRRRAIVIGSLGDPVSWPDETHGDPSKELDGRQPWVTFRDAVQGLSKRPDGVNWHRARNPRPESIVRYKAVPRNGGDRFAMQKKLDAQGLGHLVPRCWREKPTGTTDVFARLWWDRPTLTIRTEFYKPEKGRYLHPEANRPITIREAARCMTFPDGFVFPEEQAMTSVARQIGNAVPPLMASVLGRQIAEYIERTGGEARRAA